MAELDEYLYIAVLAVFFGFFYAFGIGANDVANSFGSSVSSGALSLGWAIILGSIMEFVGAVFLGKAVTDTIRNKILDADYYTDQPDILMLGNLCALMVGGTWLLTATHLELPVSTTHTIIGALIGFSLAAEGFESIMWWPDTCFIFIAWVVCPIYSGIIGWIFFKTLKVFVLDSPHVQTRAMNTYPIVVFCAITINLFFILQKGVKLEAEDAGMRIVLPVSLGSGAFCAIVTHFFLGPIIKKRVEREIEEEQTKAELASKEAEMAAEAPEGSEEVDAAKAKETTTGEEEEVEDASKDKEPSNKPEAAGDKPETAPESEGATKGNSLWDRFAENTFRQDLKTISLHENARAAELWEAGEVFDLKTERLFSYLQVFTACLASFAHGANDVANAIAPISAVLQIYKTGTFDSKAEVYKWVLALGGVGIALGFTLFGYKIIKAVGFKLTVITPSRGFCIELAAALAVSLASFIQIPVSTTQCLVGATAGVGLAGGGSDNISWRWLLRVLFGWVSIFFLATIVNAGFFAFVAYSPSM